MSTAYMQQHVDIQYTHQQQPSQIFDNYDDGFSGNVGFGSLLYTAIPGEDSAADNAAWGFQTQ